MQCVILISTLSTCVAQSAKWQPSEYNVTGSCPPTATRHICYVLLIMSPNKLNKGSNCPPLSDSESLKLIYYLIVLIQLLLFDF